MECKRLEYKGYFSEMIFKDNRYSGKIIKVGETEPFDSGGFEGKDLGEAQVRFEEYVNKIIAFREYKERDRIWHETIDHESISSVYNIRPEIFKERVQSGKFDRNLLLGVKGGDYVVPLYYVTKAWEEILKGNLSYLDFMICSEEQDDGTFIDDEDMLAEELATRKRSEAIVQNDQMKQLWKELLQIDVDKIKIDYTQFNKHMPPNVTEENSRYYFTDVPDGVSEWVMGCINHSENPRVSFDCVSCLMEFVNYVIVVVR